MGANGGGEMTATYDEISQMLIDLTAILEIDEAESYDEELSWAIAFDGDPAVELALDYDEETGKLFMTSLVGSAPREKVLETYRYLLEYNQFWADTGGARMALDSESEEVLLIGDCVLADLTVETLGATIAAFLVIHRTQQLILMKGIGSGGATPDEAGPMPGHIIA